jgi:hypothetical protein
VVENRSLGRPGRSGIVVGGDGVQNLRARVRVEAARLFLDHAQAEVHVAEELPFAGRQEERPTVELARATDVVEEGGCEKQVGAQAGVELGGLSSQ